MASRKMSPVEVGAGSVENERGSCSNVCLESCFVFCEPSTLDVLAFATTDGSQLNGDGRDG